MANDGGEVQDITTDTSKAAQQGTTIEGNYFPGMQAYDVTYKTQYDDADTIANHKEMAYNKKMTSTKAQQWVNQNGVMKVIPTRQMQHFSFSSVSYIRQESRNQKCKFFLYQMYL